MEFFSTGAVKKFRVILVAALLMVFVSAAAAQAANEKAKTAADDVFVLTRERLYSEWEGGIILRRVDYRA